MRNLLLLLILLFTSLSAGEIRIRPPQSDNDISHDYFRSLLQIAMDKTAQEYDTSIVVSSDYIMTQERALLELERGIYIDVDWVGTNIEREKDYLPIRIPLIGGLLGYRVPAIRVADTTRFKSIKTLEDLKKLNCIQGTHWPDSDILEQAGIPVKRVTQFASMYPMLKEKRGDYFPRGVNEVYSEVESVGKDIIAYDKLIIAYKFPMYFFVKKTNIALAERIEKGLMTAIVDGTFLDHLQKHSTTAPLFPLSKYENSHIIHIENSLLPPKTPVNNSILWIKIE